MLYRLLVFMRAGEEGGVCICEEGVWVGGFFF